MPQSFKMERKFALKSFVPIWLAGSGRKLQFRGGVFALTVPLVLATALPHISYLFFLLFFVVAWQIRMNPSILLLISIPFETDVLPFMAGPELKLWMVSSLVSIFATYSEIRSESQKVLLLRRFLLGVAFWVLLFSILFWAGTLVQANSDWSLWLEEMALLSTRLLLLVAGGLTLLSEKYRVEAILRFQAGYAASLALMGVAFSFIPPVLLGQLVAYNNFNRVDFPFSNANLAAFYFLLSLMSAILVSARFQRASFVWSQPVLIAGLLLSGSRAGIGGFVFLLALLLLLSMYLREQTLRSTFYLYSVIGLSVTVTLGLYQTALWLMGTSREPKELVGYPSARLGLFGREDFEASGLERIGIWAIAWGHFVDNPVLGIGIRGFASEVGRDPHSFWLGVLVETGVVGAGLVLTGVILTYRKLFLLGSLDSWVVQSLAHCMLAFAVFTSDRYFPLAWFCCGFFFSWLVRQWRVPSQKT